MRLETFALERFQSIWENRVAWNVSESGVQPLRVVGTASTRTALARRPPGAGARLPPDQRHARAARGDRGACIRARRRDHVQVTNGGSEANCIAADAAGRARRRDRVHDAELHAGGGARARPRRDGAAVAAARNRQRATRRGAGRSISPSSKRSSRRRRARSCSAIRTTPPARGSTPRRSTRSAAIARVGRRVGHRRRDLSRRGARRGRHADGVGPLRARDRDERPVEGVRPARAAHRLGRRAAGRSSPTSGRPRLHDDRARRDQRSAGAHRARAGAARRRCSRGRAGSSAPTTRSSGAGSSGRTASATSRPRPAPSPSSGTRTRSARPSSTERLRDERSVLLVPGDYFDMDGYLRIGFGSDPGAPGVGADPDRRVPRPPSALHAR